MAKDRKEKRKERNYSNAKQRVEKRGSGFENTTLNLPEGVKFFTPKKEGTYRVDIIPYTVKGDLNPYADDGMVHFERTYWVHRGVGAESNSYVCLQKTFKKPCPICEYVAKARRNPKADPDAIKEMEPKERQLWRVIDRSEPDEGIKLWDVSFHLFGKMLDAKIKNSDEEDHYDEFFRLDRGLTLRLGVKEDSFQGASFCKVEDIDFKSRKEALNEDLIDEGPNLDEILKETPYKELKKIFLQIDSEGGSDDDEDEDEAPPKKKGKDEAKKKVKPKPKDDDEDEEEDDEDDTPTDDDDEDDDESDDGDTEDDDENGSDSGDESDEDDDDGEDDDSSDESEDEEEDEGGDEEDDGESEEGGDDDEGEDDDKPASKFAVGDKVFHEEHGDCTVVHISGDGTSIRLKDKDGEVIRGIDADDLTKRESKKGKPKASDPFDDDEEDEPKPKKKPKK